MTPILPEHLWQIEVITEGIETAEQLEFVTDHTQSKLQVFYLSKPQTSEEIEKKLMLNTPSKTG